MSYSAQQLSHREEIRDAARRYCRGVDRLDAEQMKTAYWPDAIDEHGSFVGNAHEFSDYCMTAHLAWSWTMHSIYNHHIELDDDGLGASGEIYNITHLCRAETGDIDTWFGRYLDRYEKRGEEWRIIHRVCVHHGTQTGPATPMAIDTSNYRDGSFDRPANGRSVGP
ncbi:nuclear transport factor 2 family protein [bacterium]|nr:nuclear transport factor 2 family protein [bacterium]